MPIVQDEVTLFEVTNGEDGGKGEKGDDGKSTYLHQAFSWSSDGTDRFTLDYPNENLLLGTQNFSGNVWEDSIYWINDGMYQGCLVKKRTGGFVGITQSIEVKTGQKLTFSVDVMTEGDANAAIYLTGGTAVLNPQTKILGKINEWNRVYLSFEVTKSGTVRPRIMNLNTTGSVLVARFKLGSFSLHPIYTPSPKDDYENAYPKFKGEYSSFDPTPSTNPSDYTWMPWLGQKGEPGKPGENGVTPKDVVSGYLTNESLVASANPAGVVTDLSNANGDFVIYSGQTKINSGVSYSKVSETGVTSSINSSGRYVVTAMSADVGMAIYRAVYDGVTIDKNMMIVKNKQGATGNTGIGVSSTAITYQVGSSGTTTPTGTWTTSIPTVAENQFLWTRTVLSYTNDSTATGYSVSKMGGKGATGVGVTSSATTYSSSTNGTTPPTSWSSSIPTVAEGSYLWTRTVITFSDNTTNTSYSVAKQGAKGDPTGVTVSATEPTTKFVNMLWKNTGTTGGRIKDATYRWNGTAWELYIFAASNISAESLSAISANLGTVTAGTLNGAVFISEFNRNQWSSSSLTKKGKVEISNGTITSEYDEIIKESNTIVGKGKYILDEDGYVSSRYSADGTLLKAVEYRYDGIYMYDANLPHGIVNLKYQDLMTLPDVQVTASQGFDIYSTSTTNNPIANRQGRYVELTGAMKNLVDLVQGASARMCVLPVGYRPSKEINRIVQGTGASIFLLTVKPNGDVFLERYRDQTGYRICYAGSWLNIACGYVAGDI